MATVTAVFDAAPSWPRPGSCFRHEVGPGPLKTRDSTECLELAPGERIVLRAAAWPSGEAKVTVTLQALDDGATRVCLEEVPTKGPVRVLGLPGMRALVKVRNRLGLERLRALVEAV